MRLQYFREKEDLINDKGDVAQWGKGWSSSITGLGTIGYLFGKKKIKSGSLFHESSLK